MNPMNPINSTDATQGQALRTRVETRKHELEAARDKLAVGASGRDDVDRALSAIAGLLTGDLDHIPSVVSAQLSQWLETNKHLAETAPSPKAEAVPSPKADDPPQTN